MNNIINEYFELSQMENKFSKKYYSNENKNQDKILKIFNEIFDNSWIWKKIKTKEDVKDILESNKAKELLRITDYYIDLMGEIYLEDYNADLLDSVKDKEETGEAFTIENYKRIYNNEKSSQKLKDCIDIVIKSEFVCKELYEILKKKELEEEEEMEEI